MHVSRRRAARLEVVSPSQVWAELEARGATDAIVPFCGRAGIGGRTGVIRLLAVQGEVLVDVERWTSRNELCYALEAPVWARFGAFRGQPQVCGEVTWSCRERRVVIRGERGETAFEELAS
jgi:hypothetical protein